MCKKKCNTITNFVTFSNTRQGYRRFEHCSINMHRNMIDAPKDVKIVRSKALRKHMQDNSLTDEMPTYYEEKEHPEKYKRKPQR